MYIITIISSDSYTYITYLSTKSRHLHLTKQIALLGYFDNNKHSSIINKILIIMKYFMFAMKSRTKKPNCVALEKPPNYENKN